MNNVIHVLWQIFNGRITVLYSHSDRNLETLNIPSIHQSHLKYKTIYKSFTRFLSQLSYTLPNPDSSCEKNTHYIKYLPHHLIRPG